MQVERANEELRTSIYNFIHRMLGDYARGTIVEAICKEIWTAKWHNPIDTFPFYSSEFYPKLYRRILEDEWYGCYDLIEFVYNELEDCGMLDPEPSSFGYNGYGRNESDYRQKFHDALNAILEEEGAGYRFLNGQITPITNELEVSSIEQSLSPQNNLAGASAHIDKALMLLSKKPEPDYLNSVKESISSGRVGRKESRPREKQHSGWRSRISEDIKRSSQVALGFLEKDVWLYKRCGRNQACRHGRTGGGRFAFAKYMLVTCSAFVNYLAEEFW